ncbi:hypothetical protein Gotri_025742 [Gossypium trilobum]|uniref:Uncharacterized protein n=1 Tax=Gossypium trilobum TaxID=34281 RepID=A0A7J9FSL9_9ROSI|nr:hypothetical protein [Gossypium trilobum]
MSKLWDFTRISVTHNNLQELKEKKSRSFFLEYLWVSYLPKSTRAR